MTDLHELHKEHFGNKPQHDLDAQKAGRVAHLNNTGLDDERLNDAEGLELEDAGVRDGCRGTPGRLYAEHGTRA